MAAPAPYLSAARDGRTPLSAARWLADGNDSEPVLAAARADAARWRQ
jgi:hypothetical protein